MRLIIGGAHMGKTSYACGQYGIDPQAVFYPAQGQLPPKNCPLITSYHLLIQQLLAAGQDPQQFTQELLTQNPNVIIICDEVGCGIIPATPADRHWREQVGRICCTLAAKAKSVQRVFCGIAQQLK